MILNTEIGTRLRELRKRHGLTQKQMAERVGLKTHSAWSMLESGKNMITPSLLMLLEKSFNVRPEWIQHGTGTMYGSQTYSGEQQSVPHLCESTQQYQSTNKSTDDRIANLEDEIRYLKQVVYRMGRQIDDIEADIRTFESQDLLKKKSE
ncbi:MAG TPA: helix-turn-helix domain-containing protein [Bacteroidales bacterium]|nr:helix-turn-helix domain-containing protein [Bacteroidales bacterium]